MNSPLLGGCYLPLLLGFGVLVKSFRTAAAQTWSMILDRGRLLASGMGSREGGGQLHYI